MIALTAPWWCAGTVWAQQQGEEKPKPAARVLLPLPDGNGDQQDSDQDNQALQPDRGPVSGVQSGTLGTSQLRHSYWVPGLQYGNSIQKNALTSTTGSGWTVSNYVSGNVSLLEAWGRSMVGANYTGGGFFSGQSGQGRGQYHQLSSAFEIDQRRWQLLAIEEFSYLPQTSFGFGGTTSVAVPGIGGALAVPLPGLQEVFVPGQSALTAIGPRYSSASAAQLSYSVSRRGSLTIAGVYGLLRFSNSGNISNDNEVLNVGYSYALTRKDFIGALYQFRAYHFPNNPQALGDQAFQLMYARRITGRLALNLAGGPDITHFRVPVSGSSQTISGSGLASLSYAFRLSTVRLSYAHGIGSGSGLFSGSRSDQLTGDWSRPLSRMWNASLNVGFARNSSLVTVKALASPSYNSWLTGAGLNRPLTTSARLSIGYQAQIQASNGLLCGASGCQTTQVTHQIQMSLQWNAPAQVLR